MEQEEKKIETEELNETKGSPRNYIFRILGGFYLLYTSYSIGKGIQSGEGDAGPIVIIATVLFVIIGCVFIWSGIRIARKEKRIGDTIKASAAAAEQKQTSENNNKMSIAEKARLVSNIKEEETEESEE